MKTKHNKFSGFTLVELIVVITILVILGTIGFVSIGGYSSNARDSSRSSDLANIAKSLDVSLIKTGGYPDPDSVFSITYSGGILWKQGTVGSGVITYINGGVGIKLSTKPSDPLTQTKEYTYSKTSFGNFYQLKSDWEGENVAVLPSLNIVHLSSFLFPEALASPGNPSLAYIRGNYNGVVARTETGSMKYFLAVPSIVSYTGSAGMNIELLNNNILSGSLLVKGGSSAGTPYQPTLSRAVVFASGSLPSSSADYIVFASGVANAYSGTSLVSSSSIIKGFVDALASLNTTTLASLGGSVVSGSLGGSTGGSSSSGGGGVLQINPSDLSLSHSSGNKTFTFLWTAGTGNGGSCKLQYYKNGSIWTDVSDTTYNCDNTLSNQSATLGADGWNNSWSNIQVRVIRTSDGIVMGTFSQNLTCSTISGSASSTPNIDEDCNGVWDNIYTNYCQQSGCQSGKICASVCNGYASEGGCQNSNPYCYDWNGSQVYIYSWYHSYTYQWLSFGSAYTGGCGTSNCYTKNIIQSSSCSYMLACGTEYR